MTNEDAHECDKNFVAGLIVVGDDSADDGDDQLRYTHHRRSIEQQSSSSKFVNGPNTGNSHADVDDAERWKDPCQRRGFRSQSNAGLLGGNGDEERITDTRVAEERGSVVENKVLRKKDRSVSSICAQLARARATHDTGELLESLNTNACPHTQTIAASAITEAANVASRANGALMVQVSGDFGVLLVNDGRVDGMAEDTRKCLLCLLIATLHDEPTGRLGKNRQSDAED